MTDASVAQPMFQRAMRTILSISNANPCEIVTTLEHQYINGLVVRLNIPQGWGMQQANRLEGQVTVTSSVSFTLDIDTTLMDKFLALIDLGDTDGSGNISGTLSTEYFPLNAPLAIGQCFFIGSDLYVIIVPDGALYCNGQGSGTFNVSTGVFSITGAPANTVSYFSSVLYPLSLQAAQTTPVGTYDGDLTAATQNVLGTDFYN